MLKSKYFTYLYTQKCVYFIIMHSNWDKITGVKMALNLLLLRIITSVLPRKKKSCFLNTEENIIEHIFRLNDHNLNENAFLR